MVNWIAGQWPDAFRCLVNHAGLFDHRSMYYTTEELWFPEWDHGGPYYENPGEPRAFEPCAIRHGVEDADARDPRRARLPRARDAGTRDLHRLQRRGIDSRFVYFPDENHWILKPANSLQWHAEVLGWLDRYLK